jgi:hypothetical protein
LDSWYWCVPSPSFVHCDLIKIAGAALGRKETTQKPYGFHIIMDEKGSLTSQTDG